MNSQNLQLFFSESRSCAMAMIEAAAHIQRELPNAQMSDARREQAREVCSKLIETKNDVINELFELSREANSGESEVEIAKTIQMIMRWLVEGVQEIRALADELQSAAVEDPGQQLAFILVAENFINISELFHRAHQAADSLNKRTGGA